MRNGKAARGEHGFGPFHVGRTTARDLRAEFAERGVAVLTEPALETSLWRSLCEEARAQRAGASWHLLSKSNAAEISQDNMRGYLGPSARALLAGRGTQALLRAVTRRRLEPSWSASCYTYYDAPGSYMGEHCDKYDACRIAMLIYLEARWPEGRSSGPGLRLYVFEGDSSRTPLTAQVAAHSNRVVILNGAEQAHIRPPLAAGESLLMLAGCFRAVSSR
jgi:hypothetical protein